MKVTNGALLALTAGLALVQANAQQNKVDLVFRQFDPPGEITALTTAVSKWNASNPNIQVRLTSVGSADALNTYAREVQAGGGPDVAQLGFAWMPDLANSKLVLPLNSLITASPLVKGISDFLATDLTVMNDTVYGLPWTADTFVMAYRPDLLAKAALKTFPTTWSGLLDAARKLTVDTNGDGRTDQYGFCFSAGSGVNSSIWFLSNYYLWSNGARYVERDASGKWKVGATEAQLAKALNYFNSFFTTGASPRSLAGLSTFSDAELTAGLGRGDCAIGFFPPQTFRAAQAASKVALSTAPVPSGTAARISHLGGRALAINPNSKNPKEAWAFIKYLTSAAVMRDLPQYPAQRTLLRSLKFAPSEQAYATMLPKAVTFKRYTDSPAPLAGLAEATTREFSAVFSGQKTAAQAATSMTASVNNLLGTR